MNQVISLVLSLIISYLLGSIPTAYLFGKWKGIDIRKHGSGNVGATNAFRVLGKGLGTVVLILDVFKGLAATAFVSEIFGLYHIVHHVLLGAAVVVGHNWTIFLKFKGGKGIATSLGVLIGLTIKFPSIGPVLLLALGIWFFVFLIFGYVSLASLIAAISLPFLMLAFREPFAFVLLGILICILVVLRHRTNISRLLTGKESRIRLFSKNRLKNP